MTCAGVPGSVPSATWSRKAGNSSSLMGGRCRSTVRPTTFPVPPVVVRSRLLMIRRHGQRRLRASQRLSPRLLVNGQHDGVVGRIDIKAQTSRTLSSNLGSLDTLNVFTWCGLRPWRRRMLRTVVASRRRPSTPSARKRSHQRHTVGFDIPVRRIVSTSPCPEPSPGTMRARQACFRRLRGWPATFSRRSRSPSESPVSVLVDFPPVRLSPVLLAARNGGGSTISRFQKKRNHLF